MILDRNDFIKQLEHQKELERRLIRLNGNDEKAVKKRFEQLQQMKEERNAKHERSILNLNIKEIAITEVAEELNLI